MNNLEQRIKQLEQRVAALEGQVQGQPSKTIESIKAFFEVNPLISTHNVLKAICDNSQLL